MYGYVTQDKPWKVAVLVLASVPIAIAANALRVTTIILIAEYGSAEFAAHTYHNWSGFLFFPAGLVGLLIVALVINKGFKALRPAKVRTRTIGTNQASR